MEHEQTLQQLDARNPSLTVLENPGWDPVCFASVAAYLYLLPGLVRLLLEQTDAYAQQFMFHLELQERLDALSVTQADALLRVFDYLILHQASDLDNALVVDDALRLREALNLIVRQ